MDHRNYCFVEGLHPEAGSPSSSVGAAAVVGTVLDQEVETQDAVVALELQEHQVEAEPLSHLWASFPAAAVVEEGEHRNYSNCLNTVAHPDSLDSRRECYWDGHKLPDNHLGPVRMQAVAHNVHNLDQAADHRRVAFVADLAGLGQAETAEVLQPP